MNRNSKGQFLKQKQEKKEDTRLQLITQILEDIIPKIGSQYASKLLQELKQQ